MHTSQDKVNESDTGKKTAEPTPKVVSRTASSTRTPAWTSTWGDHPPAGLVSPVADLQAKGVIGQPGDPYEQEADQVADQVMHMPAPGSSMISAPLDPSKIAPRLSTSVSRVQPMIQRLAVDEEFPSTPITAEDTSTPDAGTAGPGQTSDTSTAQPTKDSTTPGETSTPGLIVDDAAGQLQQGQMKKSDFLAQLQNAVCTTSEEALKGTIWSAAGCPWVEHWFGYYSNRDSQQIERAICRYAPESSRATSVSDYIPMICERVRRTITVWSTTGEVTGVPEGVELPGAGLMGVAGSIASGISSAGSSIVSGVESLASGVASAGASLVSSVGSALSDVGSMLFKGREGGAREVGNPQAIQGQLGSGRSLDGGVRSHMESAFGADFSHVRMHTDATASGLSESLNARAFTVGQDVAFGPGEYRPGTLIGDALIAHELAHVVQQGGASPSRVPLAKGGTEYNSLEEDADRSAVGAVVSLWSGVKGGLVNIAQNAMPAMRSGLGLQRCSSKSTETQGPTTDASTESGAKQDVTPVAPVSEEEMGQHIIDQVNKANKVYSKDSGVWYFKIYQRKYGKLPQNYQHGHADPIYFDRVSHMDWLLKPRMSASAALQSWLKGLTIAECASTLMAIEWDTLRTEIGDTKFDDHFGSTAKDLSDGERLRINQSPLAGTRLALYMTATDAAGAAKKDDKNKGTPGRRPNVKVGEWYYFNSHRASKFKHPAGQFQGENSIYMGEKNGQQIWSGLGIDNKTERGLAQAAVNAYNQPRTDADRAELRSIKKKFQEEGPELTIPERGASRTITWKAYTNFPDQITVQDLFDDGGGIDVAGGMKLDPSAVQRLKEQ